MAHFIGEIQGSKGSVSRLGGKDSGIRAHIRGWDIGVRVTVGYDEDNKRDYIKIYKTSGSNRRSSDELITEYHD